MIFKLFFRLDYPICYPLIDSIGKTCKFIKTELDKQSTSESDQKVEFDIPNGKISTLWLDQDANEITEGFNFTLEHQSLFGSFDFYKGRTSDFLMEFFGVKLVDDIIRSLEIGSSSDLDHFEVNCVYLIETTASLTYESIVLHIQQEMAKLTSTLSECGFDFDNGLITIKGNKDEDTLLVSYGPYSKEDVDKYFSISPFIDQGLLISVKLHTAISKTQFIDFRSKLKLYFKETDIIVANLLNKISSV